jgi:ABC-2 type transport system ATP-binding protein
MRGSKLCSDQQHPHEAGKVVRGTLQQRRNMIEAERLTKRFGSTLAVDDLSFRAEPGQVTGFLGPNGAGKSTTMRMLLGLDRPTSGRALLCGRPIDRIERPARTVGALLDAGWLHPNRSARAHLRWIASSNGIAPARIAEVLDLVGLDSVANRRAGRLSLGMRQRLSIAAALLGDPAVLILDEPVNGLDPDGIAWLRGLVRDYASRGRTVLLSSHLLAEMAGTVDRVVVIGRGRLVAEQDIDEFLHSAAAREVRIRVDAPDRLLALLAEQDRGVRPERDGDRVVLVVDAATTDEVGELARHADCTVWELGMAHSSLEDAFMRATEQVTEFRGESRRVEETIR